MGEDKSPHFRDLGGIIMQSVVLKIKGAIEEKLIETLGKHPFEVQIDADDTITCYVNNTGTIILLMENHDGGEHRVELKVRLDISDIHGLEGLS